MGGRTSTAAADATAALRRAMFEAAWRLIEEAGGLTVTLDHLPLDRVIRAAGASRTSVYREWPSREAFYADLLVELAGPAVQGVGAVDDPSATLARKLLPDHLGRLGTPEQRRAAVWAIGREVASTSYRAIAESPQWKIFLVLAVSAISSGSEQRERVVEALRASEREWTDRFAEMLEDLCTVLGFRPRPGFDLHHVAAIGSGVVEGMVLQSLLTPEVLGREIEIDGPDGVQLWHPAAFSYLAVVDAHLEPVPDYDPTRAVSEYLKTLAVRETATLRRR